MRFVLKNPCQQLCIFSVAPCQRSSACPIAQRLQTTWKVLGAQFFETIALMEFVLKTRANSSASQYVTSSQRSSPQAISHAIRPVSTLVSLPPNGTLPNLFPTASHPHTVSTLPSRSLPTELSPSYFRRFSRPSTMISTLPSCSLPTELSPSYFPRFPVRPPCRRFRIVPPRQSKLNENASIGDAFGKKTITMVFWCFLRLFCHLGLQQFCNLACLHWRTWWWQRQRSWLRWSGPYNLTVAIAVRGDTTITDGKAGLRVAVCLRHEPIEAQIA